MVKSYTERVADKGIKGGYVIIKDNSQFSKGEIEIIFFTLWH